MIVTSFMLHAAFKKIAPIAKRVLLSPRTQDIMRESYEWGIGNMDTHRMPLGPLILETIDKYLTTNNPEQEGSTYATPTSSDSEYQSPENLHCGSVYFSCFGSFGRQPTTPAVTSVRPPRLMSISNSAPSTMDIGIFPPLADVETAWPELSPEFYLAERTRRLSFDGMEAFMTYFLSRSSPTRIITPTTFETCPTEPIPFYIPPPKMANIQVPWIEGHEVTMGETVGSGAVAVVKIGVYRNTEVVIKTFKSSVFTSYALALREADINAYMMALGVSPPIIGLLKHNQCPELKNLPGLMFKMMDHSADFLKVLNNLGRLTRIDIMYILIQVARLVYIMHSDGFLHNDIKANNVLIAPNYAFFNAYNNQQFPDNDPPPPRGATGPLGNETRYRVYLLDFGSTTYREGYSLSEKDLDEGHTYPFLAPEVLNYEVATHKSDVYSIGNMMLETVEYCRDVPLKLLLQPLILKCMQTDPARRPNMKKVEKYLFRRVQGLT